MDWKLIKDKHPKAWNKLCDYHENEVVGLIDHPQVWDQYNLAPTSWELRHLYDFFDENEIYVYLNPQFIAKPLGNRKYDMRERFMYGMDGYKKFFQKTLTFYDSRLKCEEAAFTKAFELLENKL